MKNSMKYRFSLFILLLFTSAFSYAQKKQLKISSGDLNAAVTSEGLISLSEAKDNIFTWPVMISASLKGCETTGKVELMTLPDGGVELKRLMKNSISGFSAYLTERFRPAGNSLRCEIEISGTGGPWTTEI